MLCGAVLSTVLPVQAQLSDIAAVQAQLINGLDSSLVAEGGLWAWGPNAQGLIADIPPGSGLTLQLQCFNAGGDMVYTGEVTDIMIMPVNPMTFRGYLVVYATPDSIAVQPGLSDPVAVNLVPVGSATLTVAVDIKPGSMINPVNVKSNGVIPVVIPGSADLDVESIDVDSLRLAGVPPIRYKTGDMEDGFKGLKLKFHTADIVTALGEVTDREVIELELTGSLTDGTAITGTDQIMVLGKKKPHKDKK